MDPIPSVCSLITFSFLESIIYPNLTADSVRGQSEAYLENKRKEMLPLIKLLELDKLGSVEEIRRELFMDFSTLPRGLPKDEKMRAKVELNLLEDEIDSNTDLCKAAASLHPSDHAKYDLNTFNVGIVALGVENFMMAAAQFCEEEAAGGAIDIVSVGSGVGTIERAIMAEHRSRYGKALPRIKLVDPASDGDEDMMAYYVRKLIDFKTVDHLIEERPDMVGNCTAFIIWPLPENQGSGHEPYDIEAVRKLQPRAVFVVYESTGSSGSIDFRTFLRDEKLETLSRNEFGIQNWLNQRLPPKKKTYELDNHNYKIIEIAHQKIWFPRTGTYIYRMVKLKRGDLISDDTNGVPEKEGVLFGVLVLCTWTVVYIS